MQAIVKKCLKLLLMIIVYHFKKFMEMSILIRDTHSMKLKDQKLQRVVKTNQIFYGPNLIFKFSILDIFPLVGTFRSKNCDKIVLIMFAFEWNKLVRLLLKIARLVSIVTFSESRRRNLMKFEEFSPFSAAHMQNILSHLNSS